MSSIPAEQLLPSIDRYGDPNVEGVDFWPFLSESSGGRLSAGNYLTRGMACGRDPIVAQSRALGSWRRGKPRHPSVIAKRKENALAGESEGNRHQEGDSPMSTDNDTSTISELIPITEQNGQQVASGRDLHAYLGLGRDYTTWFKKMTEYGFVEGQDYLTVSGEVAREGRGMVTRIDHAVTFDMAKELGMIQRTEQGKQIRQYFIEVEKVSRVQTPVAALPSRAQLAQMVLDAERELEAAKMQAELDAPKIRYHERFIAETDDIITIEYFAAHWGTTGPKVRQMLKDKKIAVRRCIGKKWSRSKGCMVDEYEWRPRAGTRYVEWFVVRPQHNAPRHHNGQVRQTMYLFAFHSEDLAQKLGLTQPAMFTEGAES